MATLKCNSCGGDIASNARRVQCPHCGDLFPFACAQCERKLRPPFSVFDDERHLTFDDPPLPLCDEHYLRKCPDCDAWFHADANPGYFRCADCRSTHDQKVALPRAAQTPAVAIAESGGIATRTRVPTASAAPARSGPNPAIFVIAFAVCAVLAVVGWLVLGR